MVVTLEECELLQKYYNEVTIGLLFLKMQTISIKLVIGVKEFVISQIETKCIILYIGDSAI